MNYDWHYNLIAIKEKLAEIQNFNYVHHLSNKARVSERMHQLTE